MKALQTFCRGLECWNIGMAGRFKNHAEKAPGLWETLGELLFGVRRLLDCVQIEVSARCPGRCVYCPHTVFGEERVSRDMAMETFARIWPLMRRSSRVHLQGWGEPLLNASFFEMAALARKAGCAVSTTTSGLPMSEAMALKIVESGMDIVAFSIVGSDAAGNASRRGVDFDRVCEAVSTLQRVRRSRMGVHLEIHFAYLMLASTMASVRGLPGLMERLGVHAAVISTLDYIAEPGLESEGFSPRESEKLEKASVILRETESEARRMGLDFYWSLPRPAAAGKSCRENVGRSLFVAADGSVSPCVYLNMSACNRNRDRRVFGNVCSQDPIFIWEGEDFRRFRNRMEGEEPDRCCISCLKRFESADYADVEPPTSNIE
jgi:MoaA/NifB/PqqE/SkfB family radical SAM enzyme